MKKTTINNIENVQVKSLIKDPNHPRQESGNLDSLITSVKKDGIISPVTVIKINESVYHIIDGVRRIDASKKLGIETITCIVLEGYDPATAAHKSFILNNERNQLNAIEIARHIKKMRDEFDYSYTDLEIMGYGSRSSISKRLSLLELPVETQEQIASGKLTAAHGEAFLKHGDPEKIKKTAKLAIENDWSAKKTKAVVERHNRKMKKAENSDREERIPTQETPGVYFKDAKDMGELPDESVGCVLTSPPYFVGMEYEKGITYNEHLENIETVLSECARVLVPGGVMAINVGDILNFKGQNGKNKFFQIQLIAHIYQKFLRKHDVYLMDQIIWVKDSNPFTLDDTKNYTEKTNHTEYSIIPRHESILIFRKKGERPVPSEDVVLESMLTREQWKMYAPSVWKIDRIRKADGHPCPFPDELASRIIKMYSFVGETVLDPFLGSGTTIKVARELGRDGVGYERDLRYKATIMKKLGVEVPAETEGVVAYSKKVLDELDANQPVEPEVEVMASEGMLETAEEIISDKQKELETV
jgi:ParB/RepB/Spo0J family partition protein